MRKKTRKTKQLGDGDEALELALAAGVDEIALMAEDEDNEENTEDED